MSAVQGLRPERKVKIDETLKNVFKRKKENCANEKDGFKAKNRKERKNKDKVNKRTERKDKEKAEKRQREKGVPP